MRLRGLVLLVAIVLAALAGLALLIGHPEAPPARSAPPPAARGVDIETDPTMRDVLPMHKAVRIASRRFAGKVLEIDLSAPSTAEMRAGIVLVYRIRMMTPARDVLDIRMDALSGRFVDVRGTNLPSARRGHGRKDD